MANVFVNDETLVLIGDAIRGKNGETTQYKPAEMPGAIAAIPTGGGGGGEVLDYLTNPDKYGYAEYSVTSSAGRRATLPEGVTLDDIVLIAGVGGYNNASSSARSVQHIAYVYCPALYDNSVITKTGETVKYCIGFGVGAYSSTYETDPFLGVDHHKFYAGQGYVGAVGTPADNPGTIGLYGFRMLNNEIVVDDGGSEWGFMLAKNGNMIMVYKKKEV